MKAFELAKKLDRPVAEIIEEYKLKSHFSNVPESVAKFVEERIPDEVPEPEPAPPAEPDPDAPPPFDVIHLSIRCLGGKSPHWKWRKIVGM